MLTVELPPGAKLEDTTSVVQRLYEKLHQRIEVNQVFATIGTPTSGRMGNGGSAGEVNKANIIYQFGAARKDDSFLKNNLK